MSSDCLCGQIVTTSQKFNRNTIARARRGRQCAKIPQHAKSTCDNVSKPRGIRNQNFGLKHYDFMRGRFDQHPLSTQGRFAAQKQAVKEA